MTLLKIFYLQSKWQTTSQMISTTGWPIFLKPSPTYWVATHTPCYWLAWAFPSWNWLSFSARGCTTNALACGRLTYNPNSQLLLAGCSFPWWLWMSNYSRRLSLTRSKIFQLAFCWRTISIGSQGPIPKDQQVKALHIYVDKLDVNMAKPLLMALYTSKTSPEHQFPLHIRMRLVPELDAILNTKEHQNVDKLQACQNTWLSGKLVQRKMWEIELLDDESELLGLSLRDAMMTICHPTNKKFTLFHTIDKHFWEKCHVLTVLKSAESLAHAMITAMLPYLLWQHAQSQPGPKASEIKKVV